VTPLAATAVAFGLRKVIDGSLSTIDRNHSFRILVFGSERIYMSLSVLLNHRSSMV
jgi:hypothetical protein